MLYVTEKYGNSFSKEQLWDLSEVFNTIVLNLPQFAKLFPKHKEKGYPVHKKLELEYREFWKRSEDIDDFLRNVIENRD